MARAGVPCATDATDCPRSMGPPRIRTTDVAHLPDRAQRDPLARDLRGLRDLPARRSLPPLRYV